MKRILVPLLLALSLSASDQIVLVVAEDLDHTVGTLQTFEKKHTRFEATTLRIQVNLGRNGLAWGIGSQALEHPEGPRKHEGDGRAPAGIFRLDAVFGQEAKLATSMPYTQMREVSVCVDDEHSPHYDQIVTIDRDLQVRSLEWMRRDDQLYTLGVTVAHNPAHTPGEGSCIFMHVQKADNTPTAGCTSMLMADLKALVGWLDPAKEPLLVQVPRSSCPEIEEGFPGVICP